MNVLDSDWREHADSGVRGEWVLRGARLVNRLTRRRRFADPVTGRAFEEKRRRVMTAMELGTPDRVPVITNGVSFYPAHYAGVSFADYLLNRRTCRAAYLKYVRDHPGFDGMFPPYPVTVGRLAALSRVDYLRIPGIDLPDDLPYQFIEVERMDPGEYPLLLEDVTGFFRRVVMPRVSELCDPESGWPRGLLLELAWEFLSTTVFYNHIMDIVEREYGVPVSTASAFVDPYDMIAIFLRGMVGISRDMRRRPDDVRRAAELMVPVALLVFRSMALSSGINVSAVMCERAFSLSPDQFSRFCLPTLKKLVAGLLDSGIVPVVTLEGDCTHLFEKMRELPAGKCVCNVDTGDIFKAAGVLAGHMCVVGNVPMQTMVTGTPDDVRRYCDRLLQEVAPGGGFILSGALGIPDNARPENVRAMVDYVLENGAY